MIEFVERVGVEPKVFPGMSLSISEDKPEDKVKEDNKKHKKDDDGDAALAEETEHEENGSDKKDVSD